MELKRVVLSVVKYHSIHFVLMRTSAYLGKVAEKYTLLQTKQKSHNGDRGVTEDIHSSNAVLSDMVATSHMCLLIS